jgi:hypothetical protein
MPQYAFSFNRENWSGAFKSRDEALAAGIQKSSGATDLPEAVFVGEIVGGDACADHLAKVVINELRDRGRQSESTAGWLRQVSPEQKAELDQQLERLLVTWLQKHSLLPQAMKVDAISEHPTAMPHRGLGPSNGQVQEVQDLGVSESQV